MNSIVNDHLRSDKLKWAESAALALPSTLPPVVLLNYDVVFINIVINVAIIFMRGLVVLPAAVTEGCPLLVTSAQGHLLVGLRDKTVTRLWLSLLHRWGNNSGDDYSDDGDVRVALTCHSCPH